MKIKYPDKKLFFVMDNLLVHKSSLVWKIMQDEYSFILFTPAVTPEFSPIENMFAKVKN